MAQFKIYSEREHLSRIRLRLSEAIHGVAMEILGLPANKRFHRFIGLESEGFIFPPDRSPAYTIIEVSMFEGRGSDTKQAFLMSLMQRVTDVVGLAPADLEVTLFETPRSHWGIRGEVGDRLALTYDVER